MAATNINVAVISGNLTHDPDLRNTSTGHSVCELRVANNVPVKRDGKWESKANFFQVNAWGALGENCAKHLEKGSPVFIQGRLEWQMWKDKDNPEKSNSRIVLVADNVQFGYKAPKGTGSGSSQPDKEDEKKEQGPLNPDDIPF